MFCPNCGKEQLDNPKFCRNCGAELVQESVVRSDNETVIEPSVEPRVNQQIQPEVQRNIQADAMLGFQPKPRSAALKWGTGLLFVLTALQLLSIFNMITLAQEGIKLGGLGNILCFILTLIAAIHALRRKHWVYVLGVTIWLPISTIIGTVLIFAMGQGDLLSPVEIIVALSIPFLCIILISKAKADFSQGEGII